MKINWKLRLKNKATLITLATLIIGFIYQILAIFEVVPKITQDNATAVLMLVINVLAGFGVVVDPTTKGISDSQQALTYEAPKGE